MPAKKNRRRKSKKSRRRPWVWVLSALLLLAGSAAYLGYLDSVVRQKFEGKRWALPARVFARPLELYVGAPVGRELLQAELERLGYQRALQAAAPGSYSVSANRVELHSRGFEFSDGVEPPIRVLVEAANGTISSIVTSREGDEVQLVRLEPVLVGSFYPASNEDRLLVQIGEVPKLLIQALIAMEDRDFYQHHGISPRGIARAVIADLRAGKLVQGGSTLTQQLVKNFYLSSERSVLRKVNEAAMAVLLELHYEKNEILEAYLNEVFLGQAGRRSVHGFAQGARLFFGRPLAELSPGQLALLAGMVKAPSTYSPRENPEQARQRRDLVLDVLVAQGVLDEHIRQAEKNKPLGVKQSSEVGLSLYPDFLDLVRRQLRRDYPDKVLRSEGLRIFSTLNPQFQAILEQVVVKKVAELTRATGAGEQLQAAMVIADVANSEVLAMVGSRTPRSGGFNRAIDAQRSIGSLIKPAIYLSALSKPERYQFDSILLDAPLEVTRKGSEPWLPKNADRRFRGEVPLFDGLLHSLNVPTIRLGLELGLSEVVQTLINLGLQRPIREHPSLLLGAVGLSPLEVNQLYLTLAAGGFFTPQRGILSVADQHGETLSRYTLQVKQTLDPRAAQLLQYALQEVGRRGTAKNLGQWITPSLNLAVKTGTTDDNRDSWFAGFSANISAVAWVGRDDNKPTRLYGSTGAMPIWGEVMAQLPLVANASPLNKDITWVVSEPNGAALTPPAGVNCFGGYGVPKMSEFVSTHSALCNLGSPVPSGGGASENPLQWLLDKLKWSDD